MKDDIKQILKDIVLEGEELYSQVCKVVEVDTDARSCTLEPINGDANINNARIQASLSANEGIYIEPKKDSFVVCTFLNKNISVITLYTEIEKYSIKVNNTTFDIDKDVIKINGDGDGGLTKTPVLRTELNKVTARVTALEALILAFAGAQVTAISAVPLLAPLGPAYSALAGAIPGLPPQGLFNTNIESDKNKQG